MNKQTILGKAGKFNIRFEGVTLTSHSGAVLLKEFIDQLGVEEVLAEEVKVKRRQRGYTDAESLLMLAMNMILGGECLSDLNVMRGEAGTLELLGWDKCVAPTTAGEHLRKFDIGAYHDLVRALRQIAGKVRGKQKSRSCTIDMDASIYEQCSKRKEGSRKTYNGKTGYHPLFAFWSEEGELLASHLMSGNCHPSSKAIYVLEEALKSVPEEKKVNLRADSAFYSWEFIKRLEKEEIRYAITADLSKQLRAQIEKIGEQEWKRYAKGVEVADFRYAPTNQDEHRYLVKRIWFKDKKGVGSYRYYAVVTNDEARSPRKLMKWALQRCNMENLIKEHKSGMRLEKMPTQKFFANYAYLLIGQLAYNLVVWFKRLILPNEYRTTTVETIRHRILNLAGKIVRSGRQLFLVMPETYFYQGVWRFALNKLTEKTT
jgi:hypothetical protein